MKGFQTNNAALFATHKLLNSHFWLGTLNTKDTYRVQHDDTDGKPTGFLNVTFSPDGDVWTWIDNDEPGSLRFRAPEGGAKSLRVRNALMILAEAIRLDREDKQP